MKKEEFVKLQQELQSKLGRWQLDVEKELFIDFSMGCFYDEEQKKWKVYINNERGRHRIRLVTTDENEAFDEVLSMVKFEIENNNYV